MLNVNTTPIVLEYGTTEWFKERANKKLVKVGEGMWDFSDSALFWTDEVVKQYEEAQTTDGDGYKKHITNAETVYLKKIIPDLVSCLPPKINYVDMGPGTENKQDYVIHEIIREGKSLMYTPVDINKCMVDAASSHVSKEGIATTPVQSSFEDMEQFIGDKVTPRFLSLGLTFLNFKIDDILTILKKSLNSDGVAFINTQPREKIKDFKELVKAYSGENIQKIYNSKLRLIGLEINEYMGVIEVTDEVKIYYRVRKPSEHAKSLGICEGDKIFVFQSIRYPTEFLKTRLESEFVCTYFDTEDDYLAVLLKNK